MGYTPRTSFLPPNAFGLKSARVYKPDADGNIMLTTGSVSEICSVAPRTASKWCDSGKLKHYKLPGSDDRRIMAHDLLEFLRASKSKVPAVLEQMCMGQRELVLFGATPETRDKLQTLNNPMHIAYDLWDMATLMARPRKCGVVVMGSHIPVSEANYVVRRVNRDLWHTVHCPGPDQSSGDGFDAWFTEENLDAMVRSVANELNTRRVF
jgi:hypothetical protein